MIPSAQSPGDRRGGEGETDMPSSLAAMVSAAVLAAAEGSRDDSVVLSEVPCER